MSLTLLIAIISGLASLAAIATFLGNRRRAAMDEGKRQQIVEQIRQNLDRARERIREIENKLSTTEGDMRELKADVKHVLDAIERLEGKLDRHIEVRP
jgi:predicted RNase H-like nuclease (RuvC/YqgF family)